MDSGRKNPTPLDRVKPMLGPVLQTGTAATLAGESMLHAMSSATKPFAQVGIGYAQRSIGVFGALYYGHKAVDEGGAGNAFKAAAYTGFAAHGYARMLESQSVHAPWTAGTGMGSAVLKGLASGPSSAPGFIADAAANAVELGHSMHPPASQPWQTMVRAAHQVKLPALVKTQRAGAALMFADALYQGFKKL